MQKLPVIALSLVAAATLTACGGRAYEATATPVVATATPVFTYPSDTVTYAPGTFVYPVSYILRPGFGRVESVQQVIDIRGTTTGYRRLTVRMDDGSFQVFDTNGPSMVLGARLEITPERYVRYPIASN
jgi:multidrug efflux pump subunit AcrA (membrane-fusion protein)